MPDIACFARWLFPVPSPMRQGAHIDPEAAGVAAPDLSSLRHAARKALLSPEMDSFREALKLPGLSVRDSVLDDLASYHHITPGEARQRAIDWEQWSVQEWKAADRTNDEGLKNFYRSTESWAYDLLWYAYVQTERYGAPMSVIALQAACAHVSSGRHLDFGSGAGVTSQLFGRAGFDIELADISTSLLDFARFRLERRQIEARYLDLGAETLESARYDVITALDTFAHVPDPSKSACELYRALRPGGVLVTNFDVRPPSDENAWHLYQDDLPLRSALVTAGLVRCDRAGDLWLYRRPLVETLSLAFSQGVTRRILASPAQRTARQVRRRAATKFWSSVAQRRSASSGRS
jgi:SAM-dependent methyltransferase